LEIDAADHAQLHDGGRWGNDDHGVAVLGERSHHPPGQGLGLQSRILTLRPVLQFDEDHGVVLGASGKAETGDRHA